MNKRIGGGQHRSTSDTAIIDRVLEFKARCGAVDDVRVEDLSPVEHLKLKATEAKAELDEAENAATLARERWMNAFAVWRAAVGALDAQIKKETNHE